MLLFIYQYINVSILIIVILMEHGTSGHSEGYVHKTTISTEQCAISFFMQNYQQQRGCGKHKEHSVIVVGDRYMLDIYHVVYINHYMQVRDLFIDFKYPEFLNKLTINLIVYTTHTRARTHKNAHTRACTCTRTHSYITNNFYDLTYTPGFLKWHLSKKRVSVCVRACMPAQSGKCVITGMCKLNFISINIIIF